MEAAIPRIASSGLPSDPTHQTGARTAAASQAITAIGADHIVAQDLGVTFAGRGGSIEAVRGVDLTVRRGEVLGLVGPSGAGKSTLLRTINLLERPTAGRLLVDGEDVTVLDGPALGRLRQRIGMVFQHFNLFSAKTAAGNVGFPLRAAGVDDASRRRRVAELLDLVGLADRAGAYPGQLSGGQKQRIGIARALANHPGILLCDEPTSALDPETAHAILELIRRINRTLGITVLLVSHAMDAVRGISDRTAVLAAGRLIELADTYDCFADPRHEVTRQLLRQTQALELPDSITAVPGQTLVRLVFRGPQAVDPVLTEAARTFNRPLPVLHGRIDWINGRPLGFLLVGLTGTAGQVAEVVAFLRERVAEVEVLRGS